MQQAQAALPATGEFELQLEGGEPTLHPKFDDFVALARDSRCRKLVICTNGVALPRRPERLRCWLAALPAPWLIKLSINHYLLEHDAGLWALAQLLDRECAPEQLVLNVRLRRGDDDDDAGVTHALRHHGLQHRANVFFLQRYGFAEQRMDWDEPLLVGHDFRLVNPDGQVFGPDLLARSAAMRLLLPADPV